MGDVDHAQPLRVDFRAAMLTLEDGILLLGRRVQQALPTAMRALEEAAPALARQVVAGDDRVDADAHGLDADIVKLVTLQGPVADDLRLLLALQRVLLNVERVGDCAVNIARLGAELVDVDGEDPQLLAQIHELGRRAERAVRTGLDAFGQRRDTPDGLAHVEGQIDLLHEGLTARLIEHASTGPDQAQWAVRMVLASRHLERVGDHAVSIAEEGAFVVTGERPLPRPQR